MSIQVGMSMLLWGPRVTEAHAPVLEELAALGYDGVEVPVTGVPLDELEALESRVLPQLQDEIEHIRQEIAAKDGEGLMDEVQQWIHELNDHLEHLEARWGSRTQHGEEVVLTPNEGPRTTSRAREESRGSQPGWLKRFFGGGR